MTATGRSFVSLAAPPPDRWLEDMARTTRERFRGAVVTYIEESQRFDEEWGKLVAEKRRLERESAERCARITAYIRRTR